jgi:hypothetical protein
MLRVVAVFIGAVVLMLTLFQSLAIAVGWWQGRIVSLGGRELFWLLLLPVLLAVYLRGFPFLRGGCAVCPERDECARQTARDTGP